MTASHQLGDNRSDHGDLRTPNNGGSVVVLDVRALQLASEKAVAEATLGQVSGVRSVEASPVAQTATVSFDPAQTGVSELRGVVKECGYHCAGLPVRWLGGMYGGVVIVPMDTWLPDAERIRERPNRGGAR